MSETLFDLNLYLNPASEELEKPEHELFAQYYAGKHFGKGALAYMAAYGSENKEAAANNASRLMKEHPEIRERIKFLRAQKIEQLGIDALTLAEMRLEIARRAQKHADRLTAMRDLEKGLGLAQPEKTSVKAETHNVTETTVTGPGVVQIADPALLAALCEAARTSPETK